MFQNHGPDMNFRTNQIQRIFTLFLSSLILWGIGNHRTNGYGRFPHFRNPEIPFFNSVTSYMVGPYPSWLILIQSHQHYSILYWGSMQSIAGITVFQPVEWKDRGF